MIKKIKSTIKSAVSTLKKVSTKEKKVECVIDNQKVDCSELEAPIYECGSSHFSHGYSLYGNIPSENKYTYTGVPAPVSIPYDPWFGSAPKSQKAIQYEEKVAAESKIKEDQRKEKTQEPENIHQVMYEKATKNWNTVKETQGGSENFQEGSGGWNSGTGMGQYR